MSNKQRMRILAMIESGEVSPEEGAEMIAKLSNESIITPEANNETMQILEKVERGELSPDEAVNRFEEETSKNNGSRMRYIRDEEAASEFRNNLRVKHWQHWWTLPLWIGIGVTVLASFWMYSLLQSSGINFWFYCSFVPFLLGVAGIALAWASRSSPWLHVRVRQSTETDSSKTAFSIPLPIRPAAWVLRNFGNRIPNLDDTVVDEIITALDKDKNEGTPFYIEVDDEEDGEHVEVFIG